MILKFPFTISTEVGDKETEVKIVKVIVRSKECVIYAKFKDGFQGKFFFPKNEKSEQIELQCTTKQTVKVQPYLDALSPDCKIIGKLRKNHYYTILRTQIDGKKINVWVLKPAKARSPQLYHVYYDNKLSFMFRNNWDLGYSKLVENYYGDEKRNMALAIAAGNLTQIHMIFERSPYLIYPKAIFDSDSEILSFQFPQRRKDMPRKIFSY